MVVRWLRCTERLAGCAIKTVPVAVDDGRSNLKLTDADAIEAARAYVRRFELAPLRECEVLKVSRLHVGSSARVGEKHDERVIDAGVVFRRTIDGVRVDGPGGMITDLPRP
jgi:hypothetical protein